MAAAHHDHDLAPVQRDCICLLRGSGSPHIAQCDQRFRAKFFGAWRSERSRFYAS